MSVSSSASRAALLSGCSVWRLFHGYAKKMARSLAVLRCRRVASGCTSQGRVVCDEARRPGQRVHLIDMERPPLTNCAVVLAVRHESAMQLLG